jgi:hypothetical protein
MTWSTVWRARLRDLPFMRPYSGHPDGTPNPEYGAATKPRFDRFIIDACTRPLDQDWLNYQQEIGLRHTRAKQNLTDHADSLNHIPLRYLLAFTAVVIATSRDYLAAKGASPEQVDRMHAAFTKSVMPHVTVWTRALRRRRRQVTYRCVALPQPSPIPADLHSPADQLIRRRPRRPGIGADALPHKSDLQGPTSELWATGGCLAGCLWH